jgi:hypothetical protein
MNGELLLIQSCNVYISDEKVRKGFHRYKTLWSRELEKSRKSHKSFKPSRKLTNMIEDFYDRLDKKLQDMTGYDSHVDRVFFHNHVEQLTNQ